MSSTAEMRFKKLLCTLITVKSTRKGDSYTAAIRPGKTCALSAPFVVRLIAPKPVLVDGRTDSSGTTYGILCMSFVCNMLSFLHYFVGNLFPLSCVWYEALSATVTDCRDRLKDNKLCFKNVLKSSTSISSSGAFL